MALESRSITSYLSTLFCLNHFCGRLQPHDHQLYIPKSAEASVWRRVDSEVRHSQGVHQRYWWKHSGYALAVLLYEAGYSAEAQYQNLKFYANVVASSLGIIHGTTGSQLPWPSFMTDDGIPIELSWDWGMGNKSPIIRYSIEPVGLHAGTPLDRHNQYAASEFHHRLLKALPGSRLEWFDYFKERFNGIDCYDRQVHDGHSSQIFYAFDLHETNITSKAYFFPAPKARANAQTNLTAISQALVAAPHCTTENLQAFSAFHEYASEPSNAALEADMLAIDLIEPLESRLKIYFRSRETSFCSVASVMSLGGRVSSLELKKGLENLKCLWNAVLEVDSDADQPLARIDHRTAGILYNVEFKLGSLLPTTKVYIPVRHYASSDERVIRGLSTYLEDHQKNQYVPNYVRAIESLL